MGKSGSRKKRPNGSTSVTDMPGKIETKRPDVPTSAAAAIPTTEMPPASSASLKMEHLAAVFLHRARELKEEGNRRFQSKDYHGAMENYEQALRLTPRNHPDRAVFHSNRAACLMQMKPVQYEAVVRECSLALEAHPCFGRALFRRARALEALGKPEFALQDVQLLLQTDGNNPDALELARRLRAALRNKEENNQEVLARCRPSSVQVSPPPMHSGTSPAALGASVVNGSPMAGKGPPKLVIKKKGGKPEQPHTRIPFSDARQNVMFIPEGRQSSASPSMHNVKDATEHGWPDHPPVASGTTLPLQSKTANVESQKMQFATKPQEIHTSVETTRSGSTGTSSCVKKQASVPMRPLKLVYDHDIRLAMMPLLCKVKELRELVRKRFPSSKAVLIKYRDVDGDLVTITSTEELRLAEAALEAELAKKIHSTEPRSCEVGGASPTPLVEPLRLHIVEVPAEQEPILEDEEDEGPVENGVEGSTEVPRLDSSKESAELSSPHAETDLKIVTDRKAGIQGSCCEESSDKDDDENKSKEIEMDDWLVDFAQLFRTHIGVDPDVHIDLHELGMELCSEALEETVTSEDAQPLFEAAACKFQEVAALAFFNWGNVYMCAARKRIPLEGTNGEGEYQKQLQMAYDWAQGQYEQARSKYEEALKVKPDFYEGVLALGQESFESAKLRWSLAVASQVDLTSWDSSQTLGLFSKAEERMQIAFGMWENLEEVRLNEAKAGHRVVQREVGKGHRDAPQELSEAETKEQFLVMRFQINLFWGNILFEHSQVQYKLGLPSWKMLLDGAVKKFELAGASPSDIAVVMNNHISNSTCSCEATKPVVTSSQPTSVDETDSKVDETKDIATHP
ncbi:hypothetical protein GOP47_0020539 [Adiantum capillus-veneris]|uniref:PB1 domain-containing protein n=1 Tax=Adiantum capillus-veneris TaxID=13818 RepID=A0A9D4UAZ1_ADICA|nr:hypothetical protein GOP47_0020539 [Adiantum capillus-veneris]